MSLNMVPFDVLGMVSCAIVTLSLRRAMFPIFDFKKCDLEIWVRGHLRSLKVVLIDRLGMVSY